jgi:hypothetical protein
VFSKRTQLSFEPVSLQFQAGLKTSELGIIISSRFPKFGNADYKCEEVAGFILKYYSESAEKTISVCCQLDFI